jgi:hypothetical protein
LPQRLNVSPVLRFKKISLFNQPIPSQTMTRSELNRFAGVLPTPCRCDGNPPRQILPLAKSAFATRTLSLQPWQSKHQDEFIL